MQGSDVKEARERAGWTQIKLARKLRVSQAYVSMLERDLRPLSPTAARRLLSLLKFSPSQLPLRGEGHWNELDDETLAHQLAGLGYPGFAHMRREPKWNPMELLIAALRRPSIDVRVAEGLPWLVLFYRLMDWNWVLRQAKLRDLQNRLGFAVTLARELAEKVGLGQPASHLRQVESELKRSLLATEDTFCNDRMTQVERRWLRTHRTPEAAEWNLLSNVAIEHLSHAI